MHAAAILAAAVQFFAVANLSIIWVGGRERKKAKKAPNEKRFQKIISCGKYQIYFNSTTTRFLSLFAREIGSPLGLLKTIWYSTAKYIQIAVKILENWGFVWGSRK